VSVRKQADIAHALMFGAIWMGGGALWTALLVALIAVTSSDTSPARWEPQRFIVPRRTKR
jgi:hypothetical protein